MGIKFDPVNGHWLAFHSKRHPITRQPISLRRKGFKKEVEARRVERELIVEVERRCHEAVIPKWQPFVEEYCRACLEKGMMKKTVDDYHICLRAHTYDS